MPNDIDKQEAPASWHSRGQPASLKSRSTRGVHDVSESDPGFRAKPALKGGVDGTLWGAPRLVPQPCHATRASSGSAVSH
eukprot:209393-Prymnesium_polylepis.1